LSEIPYGIEGKDWMQAEQTFAQLERQISQYDLLRHPFYEAWSAGTLTETDLQEYASEYYHHVAAFPTYLSALHSRLPDGALRRVVLRSLCEEEIDGVAHSELWLDFAEGVGADRDSVRKRIPLPHVQELISTFRSLMQSPSGALAAFYAYESQAPRIAKEKARSLVTHYRADLRTCRYFELHRLVDQHHSRVWKQELEKLLSGEPALADEAFGGAAEAARSLWRALDGIEESRQKRLKENRSKIPN
jgi:pyrroloquinoline-quinone synthase